MFGGKFPPKTSVDETLSVKCESVMKSSRRVYVMTCACVYINHYDMVVIVVIVESLCCCY